MYPQGLLPYQSKDTRANPAFMNMSACPGPLTKELSTFYSGQETVAANCYFSEFLRELGSEWEELLVKCKIKKNLHRTPGAEVTGRCQIPLQIE